MGEEGEKEWEYNGGGDLVQGTLYAWMELSQRNPLELLMHGNSKNPNFIFLKVIPKIYK
jgi:hypothetical protein